MNEVLKTIKSRRSVRKYKPEQISQESLAIILEAGVYAPSAHNEQPWHFTVIQNKELLDRINSLSRESMQKSDIEWVKRMSAKPEFKVTYDAPTLIIVSGRKDAMAYPADCAAAIQNMLLAAESLNIGSVWLGLVRYYFSLPGEVKSLNIPYGYEPYYGVVFGHKAVQDQPAPKRNMEVINYIR